MALYFCSELSANAECLHWLSIADFLTFEEAAYLGGSFFLVTLTAWGFSFVIRFILGMSPGR